MITRSIEGGSISKASTAGTAGGIGGATYLRLVAVGAAIGIPAALVAALFLAAVHELQHWLWDDLPGHLGVSSPPWYLVVGLPAAGACVVVAARRLLPGDGGHEPLGGINTAPTPVAHAPGVALAAIGGLAFGAVLGPEAPLIALGSVVGIAAGSALSVAEREQRVLGAAGSFSAVSAVFGGPIVAGVMMVEAGLALGSGLIAVLLPGFVAAAIGYVLFVGLGSWGGLDAQSISVQGLPAYEGTHLRDLVVAVAVGLATAVAIGVVRRLATRVAREGEPRLGIGALLVLGGLAVGVIAQVATALGAESEDVLFSGQASVPSVVTEDSTRIVVIVLVAKGLAYAVCLGCGFRGGPVFPAILLGVALATLPVIWLDMSPTVAVAIGAAAGMAAGTRLLLTAVLFGALLVGTGGLDAVPATVLAAAAAWIAATGLERRAASPGPGPGDAAGTATAGRLPR